MENECIACENCDECEYGEGLVLMVPLSKRKPGLHTFCTYACLAEWVELITL